MKTTRPTIKKDLKPNRAILFNSILVAWLLVMLPGRAFSAIFFDILPSISRGLSNPTNVAVTPTGETYVADSQGVVYKYDTNINWGNDSMGGLRSAISVSSSPRGLAVRPDEETIYEHKLYVGSEDGSVKIFDSVGLQIGSLNSGIGEGRLFVPGNIAFDPTNNNVYVVDLGQFHECIKVYDAFTGVYKFTLNDPIDIDEDDKIDPQDVAIVGAELFVPYYQSIIEEGDVVGHKAWIQVLDLDGNPLRSFGAHVNDGGMFLSPHGITADNQGVVYISDTLQRAILCFNSSNGEYIDTILDQITPDNIPSNLTMDSTNRLFVVSNNNDKPSHLVRVFQIKTTSPPDGAVDVGIDTTLTWPAGDAVSHDLYLDTVTPPNHPEATFLTTATYAPPPLSFNTTYYWQIVSRDESGTETAGPVWSFSTDADTDNDGFADSIDNCPTLANPEQTDSDGDGHGDQCDCGPTDNTVHPGAPELCDGLDNNCDTQTDEGLTIDADSDGYSTPGSCAGTMDDCNDTSNAIHPGAAETCGDGVDQDCLNGDLSCDDVDNDSDGQTENEGDCNDADAAIFSGAPEICDGKDNDCDTQTDEGLTIDADSDGYSTPGSCAGTMNDCNDASSAVHPGAAETCDDGIDQDCLNGDLSCDDVDNDFDGQTENEGDCNDADAAIFSGAPEICDGKDNDCDTQIDEGLTIDADGDGYSTPGSCAGTRDDCNDASNAVHPGAAETCGDGVDQDCLNGDLSCDDVDNDFDGQTENEGDCNDADAAIFSGNPEICDGKDNNCDTQTDEGLTIDADSDGYSTPGSCAGTMDDCNDASNAIHPGAAETCGDGIDQDCLNGDLSCDDVDNDFDGQTENEGDCNDADAAIFSGAPEICDGKDNDCDTQTDEGLTIDADGDGYSTPGSCAGTMDDCNDASNAIHPGAAETCGDGIDQDCLNGDLSCDDVDNDFDGQTENEGDCNDADAAIFSGAPEICDGKDNNCANGIDEGDADNDGIPDCDDNFPAIPIIRGDINNDGTVNLVDTIIALQVANNLTPAGAFFSEGDVDGDSGITMAEAIYGLQTTADLRQH